MKLYFTLLFIFIIGLNVAKACNVTISTSSTSICIGKNDTLTANGANTYTWFPGGSTGNTIVVSPSTTTTYTVYAVDAVGCLDTAYATIVVNTLPTVTSSAQNATVCEGISPVLSGFGANTYKWQPGNYSGSVYNATPATNTTYTVTGTNSNGCTNTSTVSIAVTPAPKPILLDSFAIATFGTPFNNCSNFSGSPVYSVSVSTPSVSTITSYDINWGNGSPVQTGLTFSSFPLHQTYNSFGVYNLTFTAHYANGCKRDTLIKVINQTNPAIGISNISGNTLGCAPIGYWFKMSNYQSNATGTYYVWDFGDGTTPTTWNTVTTDSIFHLFTTSSCGFTNNEFTASVTAINSCAETKATVSSIKIFKKPDANFVLSPNPVCVGTSVAYSNSSTPAFNAPSCGLSSNWNWNFGDGNNTSNSSNSNSLSGVSHTYTTIGNYTVTLIGSGGCGSDTIKKTICVEDNIVNYTMALPSLCSPAVMGLNNISPNTDCVLMPYTWVITKLSSTCTADSVSDFVFLGGTNSNSLMPNIRFNNQGTYSVRLQHTNSCGFVFKDTTITIKRKPIVSISSLSSICESATLFPTAITTNCGVNSISYLWNSVGANPSSSVSATPSFNYSSGTYTISLTATNECGSSVATKNITVNPTPTIVLQATPNPICVGQSSTITASGASTYSWMPNSSIGNSKIVVPSATTIYTVTASSALSCTNTKTISIGVNSNPSLLATNTIPTCIPGNDASITIVGNGGTPSYNYQLNGGTTQTNPVFTSLGIGIYTLTIADANGCTASITKNISTPNSPNINNVTKVNVSCNGLGNGSIQVNANGGIGALQYTLQPSSVINSTGTFGPLVPNNYTITVKDANGCSVQTNVNITQPQVLAWTTTSSTNVSCFGGNDGSISVQGIGGTTVYNYSVMPGGTSNSTGNFYSKPIGTYTITLTDAKGCTLSTSLQITQPPALAWTTVTKTNLLCNAIATGSINAIANGGTGTIIYKRIPNNTTNTTGVFNNLLANTYTIIATDANNCSISSLVSITQPTALSITNIASTLPTCNPGNDGTITVTATGGTPIYSYQLNSNTSQANNNFAGLGAGIYTITITDINGCTTTSTKSLITPNAPSINVATQVNVSCFGSNNGSIQINASGGTGVLTYKLMPSNTTNSTGLFSLLAPNNYTITVKDASGCEVNTTIIITEPQALIISNTSIIPASCFGSNNGSIAITANGGTPAYSYNLQPGNNVNTTGNYTNKPAGSYTIIVTDTKNCTVSTTVQITQAPTLIWNTVTSTNLNCFGIPTGTISATTTGGNGVITYTTNSGAISNTNGSFSLLAANTYTVVATDANNCSISSIVNITQPTALAISNSTSTNPSCNPGGNGTISFTAIGGTPVYSYFLNGVLQPSNNITGLSSGVFNVSVSDSKGCSVSSNVLLVTPNAPIIASTTHTNINCNGQNNGTIQVIANGGAGVLSYKLMPNNTINTSGTFNSLVANNYTVSVTDNNGCIVQTTIIVAQPQALNFNTATTQPILCNGGNNGSIATTITGGTGAITYTLQPLNITNNSGSFNNLTTNIYTILATDANACSTSTIVNLPQPNLLILDSIVSPSPTCAASNFSIYNHGGTMPYSYTLNNGTPSTSNVFTNLTPGIYTIVVTDANGCTISTTKSITLPNAPVINSLNIKNVSCFGLNNGAISNINANGGNGTYSYSILPNNGFSNLTASTYTIIVTDGNNCTSSSIATITQPALLTTLSINKHNISCHNLADGSIAVLGTGGSGSLDYKLQPNNIINTTGTFTGLSFGSYTIVITDDSSCTFNVPFTISNPPILSFLSVATTPISCNGLANGSVVAIATGGAGGNIFSINPAISLPNTTGVFQSLYASSFTVTVTDSNACSKDSVIAFAQAQPVSGSYIIQQNVLCNGATNGSFIVFANTGNPPFTYYLLNSLQSNTTGIFNNLAAGTYSVQIVDSSLCNTIVSPIIITEPNPITWSNVSTVSLKCANDLTDLVSVVATGGTGLITYSISPLGPQNNSTGKFTQLSAQTYTITAKDANNCATTTLLTVSSNPPIMFSNVDVFNPSCNGDTNGFIKLNATGGTFPYQYQINGNGYSSNSNFINLSAGNYFIQMNDFLNCKKDTFINLTESGKLFIDDLSVGSVICNKASDATLSIKGAGSNSSFVYSLLPDSISNLTGVFNNLASGNYTLIIKDSLGCSIDTAVFVTPSINPLAISIISKDLNCIGNGQEGLAEANVTGGAQPYSYVWNTNPIQTSQQAINLRTGYYIVNIADFKGCTIADTVYIKPGDCCKEVFIPNAFSPNGDGVNDQFGVVTSTGLELIQFSVYNRLGQQVWKTSKVTDRWNGMYSNAPCDISSYYYIFTYKCLFDGNVYTLKGDVNLIR